MPRDGLIGEEGERKIAAAVASGRIPPGRAAFYRQRAREGFSLDVLATLQPVFASDGSLLGASGAAAEDDGDAIYEAFFPTVQASRDAADRQLRAAEAASESATEKDIYEGIFGKGSWDR